MENLYPFFLIIFAGVLFSMFFRRLHIPWVVGLIIGGIIVGPHGFDILKINEVAEFIGQIGLIFLMFMAGIETKVSNLKGFEGRLLLLSFVNGVVPFLVGISIGFLFGYGLISSLLIGIIFVSSSIAVVIPTLEKNKILHTGIGQSIVMAIVVQDIASLVMLSIILQNVSPITSLPLIIFYPLVIVTLFIFKFLLQKMSRFFLATSSGEKDLFQQDFRSVFLILLGTVIAFEFLGLHPIIAGFFVGLVLSDSINSAMLKDKIRTISYGIFIPTFFIIIGAQTDISVFGDVKGALPLILAIIFGSIFSKFISGWVGGRIAGFSSREASLFGASSVPQLSTTLAVAFTALTLGLIDQKLITAMILLSIMTVIIGPTAMGLFASRSTRT
jgi:Kef-type K+ transport system membrane component KefB